MKNTNDQDKSNQIPDKKGMTRREMLKLSAVAGTGIAIGASGIGTFLSMADHTYQAVNKKQKRKSMRLIFMGSIKQESSHRSKHMVTWRALISKFLAEKRS
ncbi:hypothetical protein LMUR_00455 [Listeria grayi FSL F6-1183]|uniref:Uncharacterized protein n=1 Tax=Listeria grayi FSL F6-1183 TaxID=1265827 RepID=A0A829RAH3_LISGR|nr:hypothetical protein LMUR_00455 [Listeria grayi FSL F6-1183]